MGASSELFLLQSEQLATMYDATFTKKDAILTGKRMVDDLLEAGSIDPVIVWGNIARLKEVVNSADATFREKVDILDKIKTNGVEFNYVNGGNSLNYSDDEIYNALKADLEARVELLKLAQHQDVFDAYGNLVPKVSITPRKSSVTVKF